MKTTSHVSFNVQRLRCRYCVVHSIYLCSPSFYPNSHISLHVPLLYPTEIASKFMRANENQASKKDNDNNKCKKKKRLNTKNEMMLCMWSKGEVKQKLHQFQCRIFHLNVSFAIQDSFAEWTVLALFYAHKLNHPFINFIDTNTMPAAVSDENGWRNMRWREEETTHPNWRKEKVPE